MGIRRFILCGGGTREEGGGGNNEQEGLNLADVHGAKIYSQFRALRTENAAPHLSEAERSGNLLARSRMYRNFENTFGQRSSGLGSQKTLKYPSGIGNGKNSAERPPTYSKIFRWFQPAEQADTPKVVEITGTFTNWEKVPLLRDSTLNAWHVTMQHIPAHKTHHYMLLVDGKPAQDKNSDGLAIPHGAQEEQFALATHRGPRVFMLFAQSK